MDLDAYFERIGYEGSPRPDERTLFSLQEAHLASIPYENLDLQLGEEKLLDESRFEERLVGQKRGGWCFEMNGLFSMALRQIGFGVDRLGGWMARDLLGDGGAGHHMVLAVDLARRFIADVGLGDGPFRPFPLEPRRWSEAGFEYAVERTADGWWRLCNHEHGLAPSFDFQETPRELGWYQSASTALQTTPESPFLGLAMVFRRDPARARALRDTTFIEIEGSDKSERRIASRDEYARLLDELVGLRDERSVDRLWQRVSTRQDREECRDDSCG